MPLLFVRSAGALLAAAALALLSVGLGAHSAQAQGTPDAGYYTYALNDVAFDNYHGGGTATGYFDYDPATGVIGTYDITTSYYNDIQTGAVYGDEYTNADGVGFSDGSAAFDFEINDFESSLFLQASSVVDGSGPYNLSFTQETATNPDDEQYNRQGSSGTISGTPAASAVPELSPAAAIALLSVLGAGALGLAGARRRRGNAASA